MPDRQPLYPAISPAPDWAEIFKRRPNLQPPGYEETMRRIAETPYQKPSEVKKEEKSAKKSNKKLGRGQTT